MNNCDDLCKRLENIKLISNLMPHYKIERLEIEILQHIAPVMVGMISEIIENNTTLAVSSDMAAIRANLQMILTILKIFEEILQQILQENQLEYRHVPSLPLNLIQILSESFQHCKHSQNLYKDNFKNIEEILELFRLSQDLHTKLLNLLTVLQFDYEEDVTDLKIFLSNLCQLGEVLSGLNTKSMIDNWKTFILITQKHSTILIKDPELSTSVSFLAKEIKNNYNKIGVNSADLKTVNQSCKMVGFLHKIALKLFEIYWDSLQQFYDDIIKFSITVFSFSVDYFKLNQNSHEVTNNIGVMTENHGGFLKKLSLETDFCCNIEKLIETNADTSKSTNLGILRFLNKLLKFTPEINDENFPIITTIRLIFNYSQSLYWEFNSDSGIFENLVVDITVTLVIFPQFYKEIEVILLENLLQDRIWPAFLALEIWSTLLRNSPTTCRATIETLVSKIINFDCAKSPQLVFLKLFLQRIFNNMPNNDKNALISKYSTNLSVWKWLNVNNIPLSQRFHIETIMNDLYEKFNVADISSWNINDALMMVEMFEIIADIDFNRYQLNNCKIIVIVERLWSFNLNPNQINDFINLFIMKLCKITKTLIYQMSDDALLLILNQMKSLSNSPIFKLIICDFLLLSTHIYIENNSKKTALTSIIFEIFLKLLQDRNPITSAYLLDIFQEFSKNPNYNGLFKKLSEDKNVQLLQQQINNKEVSVKFQEEISSIRYQHKCFKSNTSVNNYFHSLQSKKIKIDEYDVIISELKSNVKQLEKFIKMNELTNKQINEIRGIVNKLEGLM